MPAFFQPWLSGHGDGYFFSQYTLGLADRAAGRRSGVRHCRPPRSRSARCSRCSARTRSRATITGDRTVSLTAAALMLASPILAIQSGVYLGYLFTLGLGLLFGAALITGLRTPQAAGCSSSPGLLVGWIFMTRPFDAVLWAAAFGCYLLVVHWREWKRLAVGARLGGARGAPVRWSRRSRTTRRSPARSPSSRSPPPTRSTPSGSGSDGSCPRSARTTTPSASPSAARARTALFLPLFLFGSYLGVVAAGFGLWMRRRQRSTLALLFLMVAFPLGYFFFWGMHVSAATTHALGARSTSSRCSRRSSCSSPPRSSRWWRQRRAVGIAALAILGGRHGAVRGEPHRREPAHQRVADPVARRRRRGARQVDRVHPAVGRVPAVPQPVLVEPARTSTGGSCGPPTRVPPTSTSSRGIPIARRTCSRRRCRRIIGVPNDSPVTPEVTTQRLRVLETAAVTLHVAR